MQLGVEKRSPTAEKGREGRGGDQEGHPRAPKTYISECPGGALTSGAEPFKAAKLALTVQALESQWGTQDQDDLPWSPGCQYSEKVLAEDMILFLPHPPPVIRLVSTVPLLLALTQAQVAQVNAGAYSVLLPLVSTIRRGVNLSKTLPTRTLVFQMVLNLVIAVCQN